VSRRQPSTGPLTLVLETRAEAPSEPDFVADAPLVAFDAFLADHRVYGWIRLSTDRLTDVLNAQAELTLHNVQLERLPGGGLEWHDQLVLDRDRLLAVRAGGPRGDPARRQHLRLHPLIVQSGPFLIGGFLHAPPGIAPQAEIVGRPPMVPLSLGWLEYWADGHRRAQWSGTILFNRGLADAIDVVREEDLGLDVMTYPIRALGTRPGSVEPPAA
jgi:hypothetical protein